MLQCSHSDGQQDVSFVTVSCVCKYMERNLNNHKMQSISYTIFLS